MAIPTPCWPLIRAAGVRDRLCAADHPVCGAAFAQLAFWLLAATDGHGKNFSLSHGIGWAYRMTALYHVLSAWPIIGRGKNRLPIPKGEACDGRSAIRGRSHRRGAPLETHAGLGRGRPKEFIGNAGEGIRADRERALLCVAYETLARRGELVALEVRDIEFWPNGSGQALIRRGKTDAEGQGRVAYLSRATVRWLKVWLEHAGIEEGGISALNWSR
jgi:hypothetical protein